MDTGKTGGTRSWLAVGREIGDLLDRIDPDAYGRFLDFCSHDDCRWFFSGQGRSGLAAQMAAMRFMHLGRETHVVGEVTAPSVRSGDRLIMISGSGETPVSAGFAAIAKREGAALALLTRAPESRIAALADAVLTLPAASSIQFGGSLFEVSSLILLDAVVLDLAARMPEAHATMAHRHTNMQ